jgi:flagellar P-ring protein FlgI
MMAKIVAALLALLAAPAALSAQVVKDFVEVDGARANKIRGYGIVTGLNGNGDSPRGESARVLASLLQNLLPPDAAVQQIGARNAALVLVTAEIAPFQKKGTRMDVALSAVGDCKSLAGGELQITDLRGPLGRQDPAIYALAAGRVVVQGDARRGNLTAGGIPSGAIAEKELVHEIIRDVTVRAGDHDVRRRAFKLVLKKPDLTFASQLTLQINASALSGPGGRLRVAEAIDGGSIMVRIPTVDEYKAVTGVAPEVDYEGEPVRWLEAVLNRPVNVSYAVEPATVVINDTTKTVAWTGEVRLRSGSVMLPAPAQGLRPSVFHAEEGQPLSKFMERNAPALSEQQLVDVVKALHAAGLVKAEVRAQ